MNFTDKERKYLLRLLNKDMKSWVEELYYESDKVLADDYKDTVNMIDEIIMKVEK